MVEDLCTLESEKEIEKVHGYFVAIKRRTEG